MGGLGKAREPTQPQELTLSLSPLAVPVRRVNQAYVIATSTKVDLGSFQVRRSPHSLLSRSSPILTLSRSPRPQLDAKFNDAYFSKDKSSSRSAKEGEFFKDGEEKKQFPAEKAADQKTVDKAILAAVAQTPNVRPSLSPCAGPLAVVAVVEAVVRVPSTPLEPRPDLPRASPPARLQLAKYLGATFGLSKGQFPHLLKF